MIIDVKPLVMAMLVRNTTKLLIIGGKVLVLVMMLVLELKALMMVLLAAMAVAVMTLVMILIVTIITCTCLLSFMLQRDQVSNQQCDFD